MIPEDSSGSVAMNVAPLFDSVKAGQDIHLSIKRSDGDVVADTDMSSESTLDDISLPVTDSLQDFTVFCFLDENGNGQADTTEIQKQVDLHVLHLDKLTVSDHNVSNNTISVTNGPTTVWNVGENNDRKLDLDFFADFNPGGKRRKGDKVENYPERKNRRIGRFRERRYHGQIDQRKARQQ